LQGLLLHPTRPTWRSCTQVFLVFNEMHFQVQGPAWKFAPAVGGRNPNTETKTKKQTWLPQRP
jgi:hypothetical protein